MSAKIKSAIASLLAKVSDKVLSSAVKPSIPSLAVILIVGTVPSTTMALLVPRDPLAPGLARVSVAAFTAASLIVPLFIAKELVVT